MSITNESDSNQEVVKKTHKILKDQGYDVKISHIYELYSKLSGVKDWNSAKALKKDFKKLVPAYQNINNDLLSKILPIPLLDDEMYLGRIENGNPNIVDFSFRPGVAMIGSMGSGKSKSAFTMLAYKLLSSENNLIFIVDTVKGAMDYIKLFSFNRVVPVLNNPETVPSLLHVIGKELKERIKLFTQMGVSSISQYEEKSKNKLSRIIIHFEEFQTIPELLKYYMQIDNSNAPAYKLREIVRIGRSYGIWISLVTQRGTSYEIPNDLKVGLNNVLAFKMNQAMDAVAFNRHKSMEIKVNQQGRCVDEDKFIQFDSVSDEDWSKTIDSTANLKSFPNTLVIPESVVSDFKNGKIQSSVMNELSIKDVFLEINSFGVIPSFKYIFEKLGYKVNDFDGKYNICLSLKKGDEKTLVMIKTKSNSNNEKHINILKEEMVKTNHPKGLIVIYDGQVFWSETLRKDGISWIDKEDIENL